MIGSYNSGKFRSADALNKGTWSTSAPSPASYAQDNFLFGCWEDFQSYASGTYSYLQVYMDAAGNPRQASPWVFYPLDFCYAYDDFESYAAGAITVLNGGSGGGWPLAGTWSGSGGFVNTDYSYAYDDFESYAAGAITVLNGVGGGGSPAGQWGGNGGFV